VRTVLNGGLRTQDTSEVFVYEFTYDRELAPGVELMDIGVVTITPAGLTADSQVFATGHRAVQVRLRGGAYGKSYRIEHVVATGENPSQIRSQAFTLRIT
jgi:hypothetical protein